MTGAVTIFIEKRRSCPANLEDAYASSDFSVGPTMFFSRRCMPASGKRSDPAGLQPVSITGAVTILIEKCGSFSNRGKYRLRIRLQVI
jgi:hypothetical protein